MHEQRYKAALLAIVIAASETRDEVEESRDKSAKAFAQGFTAAARIAERALEEGSAVEAQAVRIAKAG